MQLLLLLVLLRNCACHPGHEGQAPCLLACRALLTLDVTRMPCLQEVSREFTSVWRSFKNDPLQPVRDYFREYAMTGIGEPCCLPSGDDVISAV